MLYNFEANCFWIIQNATFTSEIIDRLQSMYLFCDFIKLPKSPGNIEDN